MPDQVRRSNPDAEQVRHPAGPERFGGERPSRTIQKNLCGERTVCKQFIVFRIRLSRGPAAYHVRKRVSDTRHAALIGCIVPVADFTGLRWLHLDPLPAEVALEYAGVIERLEPPGECRIVIA